MPATLRFVTSNRDKIKEAEEILQRPVEGIHLEMEELQSPDLEAVVRHKAALAFRSVGGPLLVEDTALSFAAWGGLPGTLVRHFLDRLGVDGLYRALAPFGDLAAVASTGVGFHDGWRLHYFHGQVAGTIVPPRGTGGFGFDPLFQPAGEEETFAEMAQARKHALSMRGKALRGLARHLENDPPRRGS